MTSAFLIGILFSAALMALVFGMLCMPLAVRLGWVDRPGHRKAHRRSVPYLGGLALFAAFSAVVAGLYFSGSLGGIAGLSVPSMVAILLPTVGAFGVGLWDDVLDLPAKLKLLAQILFAAAFSQFAYRFGVLHIPGFSPMALDPVVAVAATTFFIVAVVNGFNMIDGSDALLLSVSLSAFFLISIVGTWKGQPQLVVISVAASGACLGLLFWNRPPARIYMGDAGSQSLGFLTACMLVALGAGEPGQGLHGPNGLPAQPYYYQFVVAIMLAGVPASEVLLTVVRRLLQGRSIARADQGHVHHRLIRVGFTPGAIAVTAVGFSLCYGGVALAFLAGEKGVALMLALPLAVLTGFGMQKLGYMRFLQRDWIDARRPHYLIATHFAAMQTAKLDLALNRDEILALVEQFCRELGVQECRVTLRTGPDNAGRWQWSWKETASTHKSVKWDRFRVPGTRNQASWSLDTDDREHELQMNLRVIMSEFMRSALERMVEFCPQAPDPVAKVFPPAKNDLAMSIKGFRQRL